MIKANKLTKWLPWSMVFLGAVFYCYEYILRLIPSVMVPELLQAFNISHTHVGLLSAAYYVGYVLSSAVAGPIIDKFLPRKVISLALFACVLGCILFAIAQTLWLAGFARFVIGFASAFGFVGVLKIGSMWLPHNRFGAVAGLASFLGMMTAMGGQNGLSHMMANLHWQQLSYQAGMVGLGLLIVFIFALRDKSSCSKQVCAQQASHSKGDIKQFLWSRAFWMNGIIGCTTFLPITAFAELWGIPYIEHAYGYVRQDAAFYNSMVFFGWAFGGPVFGLLFDATQNWGRTAFWGTLGALISIMMVLFMPQGPIGLTVLLFAFGFFGSSHVLVFISGKALLPGKDGTALALTNFMIMLGGMIFQPLIGWAIDWLARHADLGQFAIYEVAMSVIPLGLVITLFLIHKLQKELPRPQVFVGPTQKLVYESS